ncbi:MAG: hypothetical protein K9G30_09875, partial [Parvibaculum sp.]|nr:hypothetical protein [Parvibaculum sp.]
SGKPETVRIDTDIRRHVGAPITTPAPTLRPANLPLAAPAPATVAPVVAPATGAPAPMAPPGKAALPASMAPVIEAEDKNKPRTLR